MKFSLKNLSVTGEKFFTLENLLTELQHLRAQNRSLKRKLKRDDLTGLYNARHLRDCIEDEISRLKAGGQEPAILFIDVDHFKKINEHHGHLAAGRILGQLGRLIAQKIRKSDIAFRYGGDEFVVLVSGGMDGAITVAERIRRHVAKACFEVVGLRGAAEVSLTVSTGIRVMQNGDTAQKILEEADKAMFQAKRNSRNALVAA